VSENLYDQLLDEYSDPLCGTCRQWGAEVDVLLEYGELADEEMSLWLMHCNLIHKADTVLFQ